MSNQGSRPVLGSGDSETTSPQTNVCTPTPVVHTIDPDVATHVAGTLKALADPLRLRILAAIHTAAAHEACVCDLQTLADVTGPTLSHHLKVLKDTGVLVSERRGTWVWYRIPPTFAPSARALLDLVVPAVKDAHGHGHEWQGLSDVDRALTHLAEDLAFAHPTLDETLVTATVRESYAALARRANVQQHLVPLTRRFANQRLTDLSAKPTNRRPQVLFVCVANAGRSQLAAALMAHHAHDQVVVRSAGSTPAGDIHTNVRPLLAELGVDEEAFPKPLTDDAVRAADVVVTMGCGDVCPVIPGVVYEDWSVGDPALASPDGARAIRDDIDTRVQILLARLLPNFIPPQEEGATP